MPLPRFARSSRMWSAVTASIVVHALFAVLALAITFPVIVPQDTGMLESAWSEPAPQTRLDLLLSEPLVIEGEEVQPDAGGQYVSDFDAELVDLPSPAIPTVFAPETSSRTARVAKPIRKSRGRFATSGNGTGTGAGVGSGSEPGFFGLRAGAASRVVFVVDNSMSMNHPHDSPAKTRYRRVKLELMKCITEMTAGQSYFVIFFSNETTPMPARGLQPSVPGTQSGILRWIGQLPAGGGPTDPLPALDLALRLQPDVICFLTDGEFGPRITRKLQAIEQRQTEIHTFAFGETFGEEILKIVAANNRGEYRFVP